MQIILWVNEIKIDSALIIDRNFFPFTSHYPKIRLLTLILVASFDITGDGKL